MAADSAQAKSLVEQVFRQLAHAIVAGHHKAGTNLPSERALADELQVNRQVVREAVRRLAQMGLVQVLHGDGTRVLDFREHGGLDVLALLMEQAQGRKNSFALWVPILELRGALAPEVVRHCALRAKLSLRREIVRTCQEMSRAGDDLEICRLEERFWDLVHEGANHLVYRLTYNAFKRCGDSAPELSHAWTSAEVKRTNFRLPIAEAILAGDAERAESEVREALRAQIDRLLAHEKKTAPKRRSKTPPPRKRASTL